MIGLLMSIAPTIIVNGFAKRESIVAIVHKLWCSLQDLGVRKNPDHVTIYPMLAAFEPPDRIAIRRNKYFDKTASM